MKVAYKYTDDATLANRYLADQLSDAEREKFEAALVKNPEVAKELEATARLKVGLEKLRETGELEKLMRPAGFSQRPGLLAIAASVAVLAVGLVIVRLTTAPTPSLLAASAAAFVDQSGQTLRRGPTHAMLRVRSETYDAIIELPGARQAIELRVMPGLPSQAAQYRVSLSRLRDDGSTEPIATVKELEPAEDGFINVFADSASLQPGRYQLTVTGESVSDAAVAAETFLIRVKPAATL